MPLKSAHRHPDASQEWQAGQGLPAPLSPLIKELAGPITLLWRQGRIPRFEIWRFDVMLYFVAECLFRCMEKREFGR